MAEQAVFLCSPASLPYTCTSISSTSDAVIAHLLQAHRDIPLFCRQYGNAALAQLPVQATLLTDLTAPGLHVYVCSSCEIYFLRQRSFLQHFLVHVAHAEASAERITEVGEFPFEDELTTLHARILVTGPLAPPPPPAAHRRLMVNFTTPHAAAHVTITVPATTRTIVELGRLLHAPYGVENAIDWAAIWRAGLVVRFSTITGAGLQQMLVKNNRDVVRLAGVLDYGECWVGDERR